METNIPHNSIIKYIDTAVSGIKKENKVLFKEFQNHTIALRQGFQDDIKKAGEMVNALVTVSRAREIAQEEIKPLQMKVGMITKEVGLINKKLSR